MMNKNELRQIIRQHKRQFSRQQLRELSLAVITRLRQNKSFLLADTLLLYNSLPDEVDTSSLLHSLTGKTILLPKVIDGENMELRIYTGSHDMAAGAYGICEPTGPVFTDLHLIDAAIIPGMAFDRQGHRLGRGRGYYDRILPLMPQARKIGLCFSFQITDFMPYEPHDVIMDEVVF